MWSHGNIFQFHFSWVSHPFSTGWGLGKGWEGFRVWTSDSPLSSRGCSGFYQPIANGKNFSPSQKSYIRPLYLFGSQAHALDFLTSYSKHLAAISMLDPILPAATRRCPLDFAIFSSIIISPIITEAPKLHLLLRRRIKMIVLMSWIHDDQLVRRLLKSFFGWQSRKNFPMLKATNSSYFKWRQGERVILIQAPREPL